jgi:acyl carrier protein
VATEDSSEVAVSDLDRRQATRLVLNALTAVMPDLTAEALTERQELYADLGLDSLGFVRLLIELEGKLGVQLVDLVEQIAHRAAT